MFDDRTLLTNRSITLTGSNINATLEPFEPHHAEKHGGHSVWISWLAPDNGLVSINTAGSAFDTLLGIYTLQPGNAPEMQRLQEVSSNDDDDTKHTSRLQFGATSNQIYQIAVDGFAGQTGVFTWQLGFAPSANIQPIVIRRVGDQALRLGDPLILFLTVAQTRNTDIAWYLNGSPVPDAEGPSLVIPNLQATNLGLYTVKMELNDDNFVTAGIEIQINSEGQTNVLARNKLPDALLTGLATGGGSGSGPSSQARVTTPGSSPTPAPLGISGVALGYNGTQVFNTTYASIDTNEPPICGMTGGASYWFYYEAPASGTVSLDTAGSAIPTLLGVFTCVGVPTNYASLMPVVCDGTSSSSGLPAQVQFQAQVGSNYYVVVDGLNGARGVARINYSLNTSAGSVAPTITGQPQSLVVGAHTPVALSVVANGTLPLYYQWFRGSYRLNQQTNGSLLLSNPQSNNSGNYTVIVTNVTGAVTSSVANVTVLSAPTALITNSNYLVSAFPANPSYSYSVDNTASLAAGAWTNMWNNVLPDFNGIIWLTNAVSNTSDAFIRIHTP